MKVYALFEEVSDQYGTSKLVGVYESKDLADANASKSKRTFVQVFELNARPSNSPEYAR